MPKPMLMIIETLIDRNYATTSILEDTRDVWNYLLNHDYIAIMDEELIIPGIVTVKDLCKQPDCRNLIDCNFEKPKIFPHDDIFDVFNIMNKGNFECLPVYSEDGNFQGAVTLSRLANTFSEILTGNRHEYQAVIHDLRNPLNNIYNLIKIIHESPVENVELIELCGVSCNHALHVLDELVYLEANNNRALIKEETELNSFYKCCIEGQRGLSEQKKITIEADFDKEPYFRKIDRLQIRRAVENLLSNALDRSILKVRRAKERSFMWFYNKTLIYRNFKRPLF